MKAIYSVIFLLIVFSASHSQIKLPIISCSSEVQAGAGKYAPFLFTANNYGIYSINNNQILGRISAIKNFDKTNDFYYGIDLVDNYDKQNKLFIQQLYGGVKVFSFHLKGGVKEDFYGNHDSILSLGGTPWSKNARPFPQIYFGIPEFANVPFTRKFVQVKGGISHGWLGEKDQYVKNAYVHFKYLVFRLGTEKIKVNLGLYHVAQWGGTSRNDTIGKLPSSFKDFLTVFQVEGDMKATAPYNETAGYLGNHIASYQAGIDFFGKKYLYKLYYQSFLDDKNGRIGIDWKNKPDMILGLTIKTNDSKSLFQSALFEYIHTYNQSGDTLKSGNDNYYNNQIYRTGWTYKNIVIGTPLITSPAYMHGSINYEFLKNNRVIAFNTGFIGKIADNYITVRVLFSMNYGTNHQPLKEDNQISLLIGYNKSVNILSNLTVGAECGLDKSELYRNNFGIRCSIKKTF